jgi:hypothetical protein
MVRTKMRVSKLVRRLLLSCCAAGSIAFTSPVAAQNPSAPYTISPDGTTVTWNPAVTVNLAGTTKFSGMVTGSAAPGATKGINDFILIYSPLATVQQHIANMVTLGVKWVRLGVYQLDIDNSCTGTPNFGVLNGTGAGVDAVIQALSAAGIKTLVILGTTSNCSNGSMGNGWAVPTDLTSGGYWMAQYITPVVAHLSSVDGVHNYEVWNEPNNGMTFTLPHATYKTLLCTAYPIVHTQDTSANVIGGILAGIIGGSTVADVTYLSQLYQDRIRNCMDTLSDHPYQFSGPNAVLRPVGADNWGRIFAGSMGLPSYASGGGGSGTIATGSIDRQFNILTSGSASTSVVANFGQQWTIAPICTASPSAGTAQGVIEAATTTSAITLTWPTSTASVGINVLCSGDTVANNGNPGGTLLAIFNKNEGSAAKQIWITEVGCMTGAGGGAGGLGFNCTDAQYAQMIADMYDPRNRTPQFGPIFLYNYADVAAKNVCSGTPGTGGAYVECFGLYYVDGTPKTLEVAAYQAAGH